MADIEMESILPGGPTSGGGSHRPRNAAPGINPIIVLAACLTGLLLPVFIGYQIGRAIPSSEAVDAKARFRLLQQNKALLRACQQHVAVVQIQNRTAGMDIAQTTAYIARKKEELTVYQDMLNTCTEQYNRQEGQVMACTSGLDAKRDELEKIMFVGGLVESPGLSGPAFTDNVEGLLDIASTNTTLEVLKRIAERLQNGETIKREEVVTSVLKQVEATRSRLTALRAYCNVTQDFNVSDVVRVVLCDCLWI